MHVLGIETSCDETSIAILDYRVSRQPNLKALTVSSQTKLHARWGGVVPELAARRHTEAIIPLLQKTLVEAHLLPQDIDLIAVTTGPGLITALQVGVETAKALSLAWHIPIQSVNHISGHLVSPFLTKGAWRIANKVKYWPAVALVASGGHTELYLMKNITHAQLLGKTLDDAAGEAFDKVAKMLHLPYPGGPQVSRLAQKGNPLTFNFPRPLLKHKNLDFSFAGLKTAVLYTLQKTPRTHYESNSKMLSIRSVTKNSICASFQAATIEVLVSKTLRAVNQTGARLILVSGGVSANLELRQQFKNIVRKHKHLTLMLPELKYTGDNAAMIALAAAVKPKLQSWNSTQANANWELWT